MKPKFITLEGGEGAGKSSAVEVIRDWLNGRGIPVVTTREPGGTVIGEQIRRVLLDTDNAGLDPMAELLLMFATRAQHLAEVIRPALAAGKWVLCDRFTDASLAYQGHGRGLGEDVVRRLADIVHPDLVPDLTLWLNVTAATGLERALSRGTPDRFERDGMSLLERVRRGYLALAQREPERVIEIDAGQSLDDVAADIRTVLEARLT